MVFSGDIRLSVLLSWFEWEDASSWDAIYPFPTCHCCLPCQPTFAVNTLLLCWETWALRKHAVQCKVESRVKAGHSCTQPSSWDTLQLWLILLLAELVKGVCQAWFSLKQVNVTALSHFCVTLHQEQHVHTMGWEGCFNVLCWPLHISSVERHLPAANLLSACPAHPHGCHPFPATPLPQGTAYPDGKAAA